MLGVRETRYLGKKKAKIALDSMKINACKICEVESPAINTYNATIPAARARESP